MVALCNRADHYIFAVWFLSSIYLLSFFFSSPNVSGRRLDVYHTSTHGVALVRIYNAGLKCGARGGVEQRAPPIFKFERVVITLGIGPHSSSFWATVCKTVAIGPLSVYVSLCL